jgi:hypothetical protein
MKGRLIADWYIICGRCEDGEHVGENDKSVAIKVLRERGWKITRLDGWVCPRCSKVVVKVDG